LSPYPIVVSWETRRRTGGKFTVDLLFEEDIFPVPEGYLFFRTDGRVGRREKRMARMLRNEGETGEHRLVAALRGRNPGRPPVWMMRQAGRYLEGYRKLRARHSFLELCEDPVLAAEVSLEPVRLLDVDAAIVFYDILIPLSRMGAPLEFTDEGPVFREPLRDERGVDRLRPLDPGRDTPAILETIGRLKGELGTSKPVIGFAGAPFTLAAYLIEGNLRKGGEGMRRTLHRDPVFVRRLLEVLARSVSAYLAAQVEAGADAVQLFDTWAGGLGPEDYRKFALPYARDALAGVRGAPRILYANGGDHVLEDMASSGAEALSVDWRSDLGRARARIGPRICLQGNLDPAALFAPPETVRVRTRAMLEGRRGDPGYIANLGHGILPDTPVESARAFVEEVKA
jgi:uroporphyrinogen decarboxylase